MEPQGGGRMKECSPALKDRPHDCFSLRLCGQMRQDKINGEHAIFVTGMQLNAGQRGGCQGSVLLTTVGPIHV